MSKVYCFLRQGRSAPSDPASSSGRRPSLGRDAAAPDNQQMLGCSSDFVGGCEPTRRSLRRDPQRHRRRLRASSVNTSATEIAWNVFVDATCVDVSTDWVPLFDVEVVAHGEIVESHRRVRGFTELDELAASRGWKRHDDAFEVKAVPNWRAGDTISLGRRTLWVVAVRDEDADQPPVLVVQDAAEGATRGLM
jgi:hypothetical protein